ncbi:MAG: TIGR03013 family PEP-CTERM/XrtA system glycosyltransferase [Acidobacteriia bacterium]|nr:TIGR03013 family PEP-CTERM/XrtA system glycosyltransferase [Terriglobia bacterium]
MWRVFLRYLAFRRFGAVIIENVLLVCCVLDAVHIRLYEGIRSPSGYTQYIPKALVIAIVFQLFLHLRDVYDFGKTLSFAQFFVRLAQALVLAAGTLSFLYYSFPDLMVGRGVFAISFVLISIFLTVWHTLLRLYLGIRGPHSHILILGTGRLARELVTEILNRSELGISICGFVDDDPAIVGTSIVNPQVIGLSRDLPRIVSETKVDRIVVELQDRRGRLPIDELLNLKTQGIAIEDATSMYERVTGKIAIENLKPSWMIFNAGFEVSRSMMIQKRILSVIVSAVLLLLFSPVILLAMLLIKLDSHGPVFHCQERVGQDGKIFTLWKFRSMHADAERDTGPVWSTAGDSRVTRLGRILRRTRLDELPQLYNVLRGDMSLVGPRPERPHFVKELAQMIPFYHLRHAVKPGVTGWAQINYEYGNSVRDSVEKLQYDLFYIKHMSWLLDSVIIFETIKTVLVNRGS